MMRAFNAAKDCVKSNSIHGANYVEKAEFRYLLKYLRQYFEYWIAFDRIDTDKDQRISFNEFKQAKEIMWNWGINISDI